MEKYITSIKDLVIQAMTNEAEIKAKAEKGDAESCFQMGMIHLLGINTPIDFKKASIYLGNQSLSDNVDAKRLLGFVAECEGDFSEAFRYYSQQGSGEKDSYVDKVIKGRNQIQNYLKKYDLPTTLNTEISAILNDYSKDKASKVDVCIKIAAICNDKDSVFEVAKALYDSKDYISAMQWLKQGEFGDDNPMYASITEILEKSKEDFLSSNEMLVIDLDNNTLLSSGNPTPFLNNVKKTIEEASVKSCIEWENKNKDRISEIIRNQKEKEERERQKAEAEEELRKKRRKLIIKHSIIIILLFVFGASDYKELGASNAFIGGVTMVLSCYFWYYFIRWIWRGIKNRKK